MAVRDSKCVFCPATICLTLDLQLVLEDSFDFLVISGLKKRKWSRSEVCAVCLMVPKLTGVRENLFGCAGKFWLLESPCTWIM